MSVTSFAKTHTTDSTQTDNPFQTTFQIIDTGKAGVTPASCEPIWAGVGAVGNSRRPQWRRIRRKS